MPRIFTIILLFILLMNARHSVFEKTSSAAEPIVVESRPMTIAMDRNAHRMLGPLRFAAAWELTSPHPGFGGISALIDRSDGGLIAISDRGDIFLFDPRRHRDPAAIKAGLPLRQQDKGMAAWQLDAEAAQTDAVDGRIWISFETLQRICRYAPAFARAESCAAPPALIDWPPTGAGEAMVRFADGRFLLLSETQPAEGGSLAALLFSRDPADPQSPSPARLRYDPPTGYRPTDALDLGNGRILVLNRRVTVANGFTAVLALVDVSGLKAGSRLVAQPVAWLAPPIPSDNFEAMALTRIRGRPALWLASDSNHQFFQRSLLYQFWLPQGWVDPAQ